MADITDRTKVQLTLGAWVQSWLHVIAIVTTLLGVYFAIRSDIAQAIELGTRNARDVQAAQEAIIEMKMNVQSIQDNIKYFRDQYERDMRKYIRDSPTQ